MKVKRKICIFLVILILLLGVTACKSNEVKVSEENQNDKVRLLITKDFGREIIFDNSVVIEDGFTVYDILDENLDIESNSGGNFITSISGLETYNGGSKEGRLDWFYYVNGICCNVGAMDYDLNVGDVIWWDYHVWKSMKSSNSTVIGKFPEPFLHGFNNKILPTTIMCSKDNENLANDLYDTLDKKGVSSVIVKEWDYKEIENRTGPMIILGEWNELRSIEYFSEFNEAYKRTGTYVHFNDDNLELTNYLGEVSRREKENAGVIISHGDGLGDESPLWLVIGVDHKGLENAIEILSNNPEKISNFYSAAVVSSELIRLPLK